MRTQLTPTLTLTNLLKSSEEQQLQQNVAKVEEQLLYNVVQDIKGQRAPAANVGGLVLMLRQLRKRVVGEWKWLWNWLTYEHRTSGSCHESPSLP